MIETSVEAAEETRDLSSMLSPLFVAYYSAFLQTLTLEFFMIISRFQQQKNWNPFLRKGKCEAVDEWIRIFEENIDKDYNEQWLVTYQLLLTWKYHQHLLRHRIVTIFLSFVPNLIRYHSDRRLTSNKSIAINDAIDFAGWVKADECHAGCLCVQQVSNLQLFGELMAVVITLGMEFITDANKQRPLDGWVRH